MGVILPRVDLRLISFDTELDLHELKSRAAKVCSLLHAPAVAQRQYLAHYQINDRRERAP